MTREEQLERALAQETDTQNKLRAEIAELRAQLEATRPAAAPAPKAEEPKAEKTPAEKAPALKPAAPAK